jgi:hypothetical protein
MEMFEGVEISYFITKISPKTWKMTNILLKRYELAEKQEIFPRWRSDVRTGLVVVIVKIANETRIRISKSKTQDCSEGKS